MATDKKSGIRSPVRFLQSLLKKPAEAPLVRPASDTRVFDFYGEKGRDIPRLIYRRLYQTLSATSDAAERDRAIDAFLKEIESNSGKGDYQKLKWAPPEFLTGVLSPAELAKIEKPLSALRDKRNKRFLHVYPHCSDEFSVSPQFINGVFDTTRYPLISRESKVFTLGSCFARNIAVFLQAKGFNANAFVQAEDLNSPLSNAKMLEVAVMDPAERQAYLSKWLGVLFPESDERKRQQQIDREVERLEALVASLRAADVIVMTVGNTLDFFLAPDGPAIPVAPKFLALFNDEDVGKRASYAKLLRDAGATFRMGRYAEALDALRVMHSVVRRINSKALCVITLSPVPIDSAMGIEADKAMSAVEIDTISKSTLRAALFELFDVALKDDANTHYFPSFEIVRWIGSGLDRPAFGAEDAASRHVSAELLSGVYSFFLRKYAVDHADFHDAAAATGMSEDVSA